MVDLMMWLVIAALVLAAALQGIAYYQKAALVYQMTSDADGAGTQAMRSMANSGELDNETVTAGAVDAEWSTSMQYTVEDPSNGVGKPYIRVTHPGVNDLDAIYLFEECGDKYKIGVNLIPKDGNPLLEHCGISGSEEEVPAEEAPPAVPTFSTVTWTQNQPTGGMDWVELDASPDGKKVVFAQEAAGGGIYTSTDYGMTLTRVGESTLPLNEGYWKTISASDDMNTIIAGGTSGVYRHPWMSKDFGATWSAVTSFGSNAEIYDSAVSADGSKIFIATAHRIHRSLDGGTTWSIVSSVRPSPGGSNPAGYGRWQSVEISDDAMTVIAAANTKDGITGGVYVSKDGGNTWKDTLLDVTKDWRTVTVDQDGSRLAAGGYATALYISNDGGTTWNTNTSGLPASGTWYEISYGAESPVMSAGSDWGALYVSKDSGATWTKQAAVPGGTSGYGMWRDGSISDDGRRFVAITGQYNVGKVFAGIFGE
jgi:hypothetical protein